MHHLEILLLHQDFLAADCFHVLPGPCGCTCTPYLPFFRTNPRASWSITQGLVIRARQSRAMTWASCRSMGTSDQYPNWLGGEGRRPRAGKGEAERDGWRGGEGPRESGGGGSRRREEASCSVPSPSSLSLDKIEERSAGWILRNTGVNYKAESFFQNTT